MRSSNYSGAMLALAATAAGFANAESSTTTTTTTSIPECTAISHSSGSYFDLRPDIAMSEDDERATAHTSKDDYHAKGYDYGRNFTLNICAPVVDPVESVIGIAPEEWKNVSAYYTWQNEVYSIGQQSLDLKTHGRKLVLQYANGSPCGPTNDPPSSPPPAASDAATSEKKVKKSVKPKVKRDGMEEQPRKHHDAATAPTPDEDYAVKAIHSDDDSDDKADTDRYVKQHLADQDLEVGDPHGNRGPNSRRKSTTISFHCDPEQVGGQVGVSFVGADPDECAYFFEVRSQHACARAEPHQPGSVGPGSVFFIILCIAVAVYFGGGVFYQRTVAHARGWRQLPNYTLWAGIWNFICDLFVILVSSCGRLFPRRRGYSHLAGSPSRARRDRESENRLIDQLDEEWDD